MLCSQVWIIVGNSGCSVDSGNMTHPGHCGPLLTELVNSAYMKSERNR